MAREKITRYQHVQDILDQATVGAHPGHFGNGRFWDKPLQEFLLIGPIAGVDLIAAPGPGRGARSGVVLALKGEPPFGLGVLPRMPPHRPPVAATDIAFIEKWIDDDCPDEPMDLTEE